MRELYDKLHALMEEGDNHPLATRVTVTFTKVELMRMVSLAAKEVGRQAAKEKKAAKAVARATDPSESHDAAASVRQARDRRIMLESFFALNEANPSKPFTYREAAEAVEPGAGSARIDSLRRRGSDLNDFGWVEQFGRREGTTQGMFCITGRGIQVLGASA